MLLWIKSDFAARELRKWLLRGLQIEESCHHFPGLTQRLQERPALRSLSGFPLLIQCEAHRNLPFRKISFLLDVRAHTVWVGSLFSFSVSFFICENEDFWQMSWISLSLTFKLRNKVISLTTLGRSWGIRKIQLLYFWTDCKTFSWFEKHPFYYIMSLSHIYLLSSKAKYVIGLCRWQVQ